MGREMQQAEEPARHCVRWLVGTETEDSAEFDTLCTPIGRLRSGRPVGDVALRARAPEANALSTPLLTSSVLTRVGILQKGN